MRCPACGAEELEQRGQHRVYAYLRDGEVDGWNYGDGIEWDENDDGATLVYCIQCDHETTREEAAGQPTPAL